MMEIRQKLTVRRSKVDTWITKKTLYISVFFSLRFYIKIPVSVVLALVSWYGSNVQKSLKYHLCIGRRICDMKRCTVDGIADRRRGLQLIL